MTGLEKLVQQILDDAQVSAQVVIAQANARADEIIASAGAEGEKKCLTIQKQSELDIKDVKNHARSAALLQEKRIILSYKQKAIEDILNEAKNRMKALPDKEYFDIILRMIGRYSSNQKGILMFSKKDIQRLPADFMKSINDILMNKNGAALELSAEYANIDSGFVLVYGDVEENCSFDELFFAAKEQLQDKVSELLFG